MPSTINPTVTVQLDRERHLCFGAAAHIEFQERFGKSLLSYFRVLSEKFSALAPSNGTPASEEIPFKEFRDILWAALIHEDPDLTLHDVANMFDLHTMNALVPAVMDAFVLSMPKPEPEDGNRPRKAPVRKK
jgi:hypothetical protein